MKDQVSTYTKQCETFANLLKKVQRQVNLKHKIEDSEVKLTAIKPMSIMEKVIQMKKGSSNLPESKISRPNNLLKSLPIH